MRRIGTVNCDECEGPPWLHSSACSLIHDIARIAPNTRKLGWGLHLKSVPPLNRSSKMYKRLSGFTLSEKKTLQTSVAAEDRSFRIARSVESKRRRMIMPAYLLIHWSYEGCPSCSFYLINKAQLRFVSTLVGLPSPFCFSPSESRFTRLPLPCLGGEGS